MKPFLLFGFLHIHTNSFVKFQQLICTAADRWQRNTNQFLHFYIDVKFIFDTVRLGLSSSANILQIADVALRVVFLPFLPCF